jgi:Ca2+/H+ antiporter
MWQVVISSFCCGIFVILYLINLIFSLKTEKVRKVDSMTEKVLAMRQKNKNLKKTE